MDGPIDQQSADKVSGRDKSLANLTGGSRKGVPNKATASVKAALIQAFEQMGGVDRLAEFAQAEPGEFYKLWVKILPLDVNHSGKINIGDKLARALGRVND